MSEEYQGNSLKQKRLNALLSQEDLAYKLGIRVYTISKWENNHSKPSNKNLKALRALFEEKRGEHNS